MARLATVAFAADCVLAVLKARLSGRLTKLGYTHVKGKKVDLLEKLKAGAPKPGEEAIAPPKGGSGKKRGRKEEAEEAEDKGGKEEGEKAEKSAKTAESPVKPPEERVAAVDNAAGKTHHEPAAAEAAEAPKGE